jgi:hypothetical protein
MRRGAHALDLARVAARMLLIAAASVGCESPGSRIDRLGEISAKRSQGHRLTFADLQVLQLELGTTDVSDPALLRHMQALREGEERSVAAAAVRAQRPSVSSSSDSSSWPSSELKDQNDQNEQRDCEQDKKHKGEGGRGDHESHKQCK